VFGGIKIWYNERDEGVDPVMMTGSREKEKNPDNKSPERRIKWRIVDLFHKTNKNSVVYLLVTKRPFLPDYY